MFTEVILNHKLFLILFLFCFSFQISGQESPSCMEDANTQLEMNQCEGTNLEYLRIELARVLNKIKTIYKTTSPEFLVNLDSSQLAWEKSLEADLEMKFPLSPKRVSYGSVYPMCSSGFEARLIIKRIEFLKEWTNGSIDGEVCSGSVINSYCIQNDCGNIKQ